jgi:hypothetical protein
VCVVSKVLEKFGSVALSIFFCALNAMDRLPLVTLYDDGGEAGRRAVAAARHCLAVLKSAGKIRFKYVRPSVAGSYVDATDHAVFFGGTSPGEDHAALHTLQGGKTIRILQGRLREDHFRVTVDGKTRKAIRANSSPSLSPVLINRLRAPTEDAPVLVLHQAGESSINPACRMWTSNLVAAANKAGREVVFRTCNPALALERYRGMIRISDGETFARDVDRAHLVAAYSADELLFAACRRVTVTCAEGLAKPCATLDFAEALSGDTGLPHTADVHDCLRAVAVEQWSLDEIREGEPFQSLLK